MKWNSTIMVGDVAGALICGSTGIWSLWWGNEFGERHYPDEVAKCCDPILPAVPSGLTCWDVLVAAAGIHGWRLQDGGIHIFHDDGYGSNHIVVYQPAPGDTHLRCYCKIWCHLSNKPACDQLWQWYGALLAWIKLHEEAGDD